MWSRPRSRGLAFLFMNGFLEDFFEKEGPLPTSFEEVRQFPRFYFRSCADVVIHSLGRNQPPTHASVLTSDVSRSGMSLVHGGQLFPGQKIDIVLNGAVRHLEVMWCRRIDKGRYLVGCRFKQVEPQAAQR